MWDRFYIPYVQRKNSYRPTTAATNPQNAPIIFQASKPSTACVEGSSFTTCKGKTSLIKYKLVSWYHWSAKHFFRNNNQTTDFDMANILIVKVRRRERQRALNVSTRSVITFKVMLRLHVRYDFVLLFLILKVKVPQLICDSS